MPVLLGCMMPLLMRRLFLFLGHLPVVWLGRLLPAGGSGCLFFNLQRLPVSLCGGRLGRPGGGLLPVWLRCYLLLNPQRLPVSLCRRRVDGPG